MKNNEFIEFIAKVYDYLNDKDHPNKRESKLLEEAEHIL